MRIFGFEIRRAKNLSAVPPSYGGGWHNLIHESFGGAWQQGVTVGDEKSALAFSAVYASVTVIAADIAKLRIKLMERNDDGITVEVDESPFIPILRKQNHFQNRQQFVSAWIVSKLLSGNAYILKTRDNRGMINGMYVLDSTRVRPMVAPDGDVYYELRPNALAGIGEEGMIVPATEIIHDRMTCLWHPLVGVSPIYACATAAQMGNRITSNSTKFFDNMSRPSGILSGPGVINDETAKRLKEHWESNYTNGSFGRLAVMGDGLKYEPMTIPASDAQLIEQLKWTVEDVARCFHVPLYKLGGPIPTGNSVEALTQVYYTDCLQSLIESMEISLDEGLGVPRRRGTEFDLDGLIRMDREAQTKTEAEGVKGGIKAPNEARKRLNLAPVDGGDSPYLQQQNFSLAALAKRDATDNPFGTQAPAQTDPPQEDDEDMEQMRMTLARLDQNMQTILAGAQTGDADAAHAISNSIVTEILETSL